MAMIAEVFQLFEKYCALLDGEFHTEAAVEWMSSRCNRIMRRLERRGYGVLIATHVETAGEIPREIGSAACIMHFDLYLIALPPKNQTPIGKAHAIARFYRQNAPDDASFEGILQRTAAREQNEADATAPVWRRNWIFEDKETHAFLAALERHWNILEEESRRREMIIPNRETLFCIINGTRLLAPAGHENIYIFSFLLDRELEHLQRVPPDTELSECGCETRGHLQSLENWEIRNIL